MALPTQINLYHKDTVWLKVSCDTNHALIDHQECVLIPNLCLPVHGNATEALTTLSTLLTAEQSKVAVLQSLLQIEQQKVIALQTANICLTDCIAEMRVDIDNLQNPETNLQPVTTDEHAVVANAHFIFNGDGDVEVIGKMVVNGMLKVQ